MAYRPEPIDTDGVILDEGLSALTEILARNAHEVWARERLGDGWRVGPHRDDVRKEHPCLVPYDELPDSERRYDRRAVTTTIQALRALGYRIEREAPVPSAASEILGNPDADLGVLTARWGALAPAQALASPEALRALGERLLRLGEPMLAADILSEGLRRAPADLRLQQLHALALARAGAAARANAILRRLDAEGHADEETLGLLARTHKDLAARGHDDGDRRSHLRLAYQAYLRAHRSHGGYWSGINAATLAVVLGDRDEARRLASAVEARCSELLLAAVAARSDRYWILATLGEAALIRGDLSASEDWYRGAAEEGAGRFGDLASTRRNARLLLDCLGGDRTRIDRCLPVPRVALFTGQTSDRGTDFHARASIDLEPMVRDVVRERLVRLDVKIGFASAATGPDIVFLESILALGGEAHAVLPYGVEEFATDCVELMPGGSWASRYRAVLAGAAEVVTASTGRPVAAEPSWTYAEHVLTGLALLRARELDAELVALTVAGDDLVEAAVGVPAIVQLWRRRGVRVDPLAIADRTPPAAPKRVVPEAAIERPASRTMAVLFADAVAFSRLGDAELGRFVEDYLGAIRGLIGRTAHPPVMCNTWGDGLYLVFASVRDAGCFALDLADFVNATDWAARGLPADLNLRIALHAGPVFECTDPITGRTNYLGTHVSRGARIEPITPPGHVYASQGFAALVASEGVDELTCEYVGRTAWAKRSGTFQTFHVRRSGGHARTRDA